MNEVDKYKSAISILNSLKVGMNKLSSILSKEERNENEIQRCLTDYPILFGTEYKRLIAKHPFGAEYEADYILERYSKLYDVVEIEASTHNLYTKSGNPTSHLVHAEQQIYDWFEWIEQNSPYARQKIVDFYTPRGFIIIGRSKNLTDEDKVKLRRRNIVLRNFIHIMTYDDLLENAESLLNVLTNNLQDN